MNAATLSRLFETAPSAAFERADLEALCGAEFEPLVDRGLLHAVAPVRDVLCTDCGAAHWVRVERSAMRGALGRFCASGAGWAAVDPESLRRYEFDHRALLTAAAAEIGVAAAPETLIEGVCWRLGTARLGDREFLPIVAREMNDPRRVMEIAAATKRFKDWCGLIVCGARPLVDLGLFPRGLRIASLDEIMSISAEGAIRIDHAAAERALGLKRRYVGEHGAPYEHPNLVPLIDERLRTGARLPRPSDEARYLLANPSWAAPGKALPKPVALAKFVARRGAR